MMKMPEKAVGFNKPRRRLLHIQLGHLVITNQNLDHDMPKAPSLICSAGA